MSPRFWISPRFIRHLAVENFLAEEDGLTGDYGPEQFLLVPVHQHDQIPVHPVGQEQHVLRRVLSIFRNISETDPKTIAACSRCARWTSQICCSSISTRCWECADFAAQGAAPDQRGFSRPRSIRESDQIHAPRRIEDTFIFTADQFDQAVLDLQDVRARSQRLRREHKSRTRANPVAILSLQTRAGHASEVQPRCREDLSRRSSTGLARIRSHPEP